MRFGPKFDSLIWGSKTLLLGLNLLFLAPPLALHGRFTQGWKGLQRLYVDGT